MIGKFIKKIIEKRLFIYILILFFTVSGIVSYISLPKQNFPEVVFPVAIVTAVYPGASAEDMEELVTDKIEDTVMEVKGYDNSRSQTIDSVSIVMVQLDMNLDEKSVDDSFDDLRRDIDKLRSELPKGLVSLNVETDVMDTNVAMFAVTGENVSSDGLVQNAEDLKDKLMTLDGVRKVDILGKKESRININIYSKLTNHMNLTLNEISSLIQAQNSIIPTGNLEIDGEKVIVNTNGRLLDIGELENMIISMSPDRKSVIKLSDISTIELSPDKDLPYYRYNGQEGVLLALYADDGVNVVSMGDGIRQEIENYNNSQKGLVSVKEVYFQPDVVNKAIKGFQNNLFASIALVLMVVMVGMNIRNALVVSFAIPLIIMINFVVMKIMGLQVQFVSLAALIIVLGMLVDNSIVVSDSIQVRLNNGEDRLSATMNGTKDVVLPVFVSMLTTVAGFLSLLTLTGAYRQLAYSLPVVIITCLIVSFIVSIGVTPLMSYYFLKSHSVDNGKVMGAIIRIYDIVFERAFKHKVLTVIMAALFLLLCSRSVFSIDPSIVGKVNKDVVTIDITNYTENNISKTSEIVEQIEDILGSQAENSYFFSSVGTIIPRYDYSLNGQTPLPQTAQILWRIDLNEGDRFKTTKEMVSYLQKELNKSVKGGRVFVDELGVVNLNTMPIEMKVYGDDLKTLNESIDIITREMSKEKNIKNIDYVKDIATYNYFLDMDMNKLATLGLSKAEVQNEVNLALMGRSISVFRENGKEYDIFLSSDIDSQSDLEKMKVKSRLTGKVHSLQEYSNIKLNKEISSISHIDGVRGKVIGAYTEMGAGPVGIQSRLEKTIGNLELADGIKVSYSGEKGEFIKVLKSIGKAALVSIVLIIVILVLQFTSLKKALLVLVSIPFGALAGITGLYMTGNGLTFFALLGILSLFGCALANAIVLIEYIENERKLGHQVHVACRNAGKKRFKPILMSTMTTVLGLMPLVTSGDPVFEPMAALLIVGLTVSMIINLILVPIIYDIIE